MEKDYKQIVAEQKEEIQVYHRLGWVPRKQEQAVEIHSRLAQIITGVRRSGKSTLAHRVLKGTNYAYVNFDDERLAMLETDSLNQLLEALYAVYGEFSHLLLDEIQNIEHWHLFVNRLLRNDIKIVLTGSNSKLLSREMASHLTGRYSIIELFPFSFHEFLNAKGEKWQGTGTAKEKGLLFGYYKEYTEKGGFPEIIAGESKHRYIINLFDAIVTRDIVYRYKLRHIRTFRDIAIYLSGSYASEISYNRIKNIFGLGSENTAKNYVSYLEEAYLLACLPKFSFKKQESLRYRKIYLTDTAFSELAGNSFTPNYGRLLENVVFLNLARNANRFNYELFYYKKQVEVDFVIYSNRKVLEIIQVAQTIKDSKTLKREIRALRSANNELKAKKLTIVTMDEKKVLSEKGSIPIHIVPVTEWLLSSES